MNSDIAVRQILSDDTDAFNDMLIGRMVYGIDRPDPGLNGRSRNHANGNNVNADMRFAWEGPKVQFSRASIGAVLECGDSDIKRCISDNQCRYTCLNYAPGSFKSPQPQRKI